MHCDVELSIFDQKRWFDERLDKRVARDQMKIPRLDHANVCVETVLAQKRFRRMLSGVFPQSGEVLWYSEASGHPGDSLHPEKVFKRNLRIISE